MSLSLLDSHSHVLELGGRDLQLLPDVNLIRVFQLIFVGFENPHVVIRVSVELLANLGKSVSCLHRVGLISGCFGCIDGKFRHDVIQFWVDPLDLVPNLVGCLQRRGCALHDQLAIVQVQIRQLDSLNLNLLDNTLVFAF